MHPGNNEYTIALIETEEQLLSFSRQVRPLPGISGDAARKRLARLIVEITTNEGLFTGADHSVSTVAITDSHQKTFDPQAAARILFSENQVEEACWLIFLSVYVGKQPGEDSELFRNIYNGLSSGFEWTWQAITKNPLVFKSWLLEKQSALKSKGCFGPLHKFPYIDQKKATLADRG